MEKKSEIMCLIFLFNVFWKKNLGQNILAKKSLGSKRYQAQVYLNKKSELFVDSSTFFLRGRTIDCSSNRLVWSLIFISLVSSWWDPCAFVNIKERKIFAGQNLV